MSYKKIIFSFFLLLKISCNLNGAEISKKTDYVLPIHSTAPIDVKVFSHSKHTRSVMGTLNIYNRTAESLSQELSFEKACFADFAIDFKQKQKLEDMKENPQKYAEKIKSKIQKSKNKNDFYNSVRKYKSEDLKKLIDTNDLTFWVARSKVLEVTIKIAALQKMYTDWQADPNKVDYEGKTVLHLLADCANDDNARIISWLIENTKIRKWTKDIQGQTAADIANRYSRNYLTRTYLTELK